MCALAPTTARSWKRRLLIIEAFVVFALFYGFALRITWHYDVAEHPHVMVAYRFLSPMLMPMLYSFLAASVFLMLASPFLLRSIRSAAIRAWIIGAGALLCAGCLCFVI